jgi:hypothetical protein
MQKESEYQTDDENESQIDFESDKESEDQSELDQDETTEQMSPEIMPTEGITITRSGRESKQPIRLNLQQSALTNNKEATKEYTIQMAKVIVKVVSLMCMRVQKKSSKKRSSVYSNI